MGPATGPATGGEVRTAVRTGTLRSVVGARGIMGFLSARHCTDFSPSRLSRQKGGHAFAPGRISEHPSQLESSPAHIVEFALVRVNTCWDELTGNPREALAKARAAADRLRLVTEGRVPWAAADGEGEL